MSKYAQALLNGSEIVIVANDANCNSAIFWLSSDKTKFMTFSTYLGIFPRTFGKDITWEDIEAHFENCAEDCTIFIRGYEEA